MSQLLEALSFFIFSDFFAFLLRSPPRKTVAGRRDEDSPFHTHLIMRIKQRKQLSTLHETEWVEWVVPVCFRGRRTNMTVTHQSDTPIVWVDNVPYSTLHPKQNLC